VTGWDLSPTGHPVSVPPAADPSLLPAGPPTPADPRAAGPLTPDLLTRWAADPRPATRGPLAAGRWLQAADLLTRWAVDP
jgi:hypothetical protein